jgi:four helix bundle protein
VPAARHFSDLVCWRLAHQLRETIFPLTDRLAFARDRRLKTQLEDAAGSICRNIAEGFGCESRVEFARFLEISRRSLNEVQDCLRHAQSKGFIDNADLAPLLALMRRLYPAINNLRKYLKGRPAAG